jgi:hypothetical protein
MLRTGIAQRKAAMAGQIPATRGPKARGREIEDLQQRWSSWHVACFPVLAREFSHVFKNTMFGFPDNEFRNH